MFMQLRVLSAEERASLPLSTGSGCEVVWKGSCAVIYRVRVSAGTSWARIFPEWLGADVAVKEYDDQVSKLEISAAEVLVASTFQHENIVRPFAVSLSGPQSLLAFFPYYNQGSLESVLQNRQLKILSGALYEPLSRYRLLVRACLGLLRGIEHIHTLGFVHNALNPKNLLVNFDESSQVVTIAVNDFGKATRLVDERRHLCFRMMKDRNEFLRSNPFAPVEFGDGSTFSIATDMFSVGCLLEEILGLQLYVNKKDHCTFGDRLSESDDWEAVIDLIKRAQKRDQRLRPHSAQIIEQFERLLTFLEKDLA